jgi:predicted GIY-YIG superfamily endonuclease
LKRRTLRKFSSPQTKDHHNVYVVLLDPAIAKIRKVQRLNPGRNPKKSCVYVGLTGLTPEERFVNHQKGLKSSFYVKRYGVRLLPELYAHLNPMPYEAAAQMEKDLTEDLRRAGYTVVGGH